MAELAQYALLRVTVRVTFQWSDRSLVGMATMLSERCCRLTGWTPERLVMIRSFAGVGTEDIFDGTSSRAARRTCPVELLDIARMKLDVLNAAVSLAELRDPPGNHLEKLRGDRAGQHSIRINKQYRICFRWENDGPANVEVSKHYE